AHALVIGLTKSGGALGASLNASLPRSIKAGYQVSNGGQVKLDSNRQAIADQYPQQIVKGPDGKPAAKIVGYVPGIDQSFGELFGRDVTREPARQRAKLGLARSYQQSRLFLGLSVEDNIFLAIVGVGRGHLRPVVLPRKDAELRARAREAARRAAIDGRLDEV